jgi:hypothetical protein
LLSVFCGWIAVAAPALAADPESGKFYEEEEVTPVETSALLAAVARAGEDLRGNTTGLEGPAAVDLAPGPYAETGDPGDLALAEKAARTWSERAGPGSRAARALYDVAWAGGGTLDEANRYFTNSLDAEDIENVMLLFARARALGVREEAAKAYEAALRLLDRRMYLERGTVLVLDSTGGPAGFEATVGLLELAVVAAAWSGSPEVLSLASVIAKELLSRNWDGDDQKIDSLGELVKPDGRREYDVRSIQSHPVLWEAAWITGRKDILEKVQQSLSAWLPDHPDWVGRLAWRVAKHPAQMALVGDPADSTVRALREAAWFLFEPRKILLHLNPATDGPRFEELGYPPEYAPALFVCVESVCSPPL